MGSHNKKNPIVSSLLAGAAIYFGLTGDQEQLGDITKTAVSRVVDDQVVRNAQAKNKAAVRKANKQHRRRH